MKKSLTSGDIVRVSGWAVTKNFRERVPTFFNDEKVRVILLMAGGAFCFIHDGKQYHMHRRNIVKRIVKRKPLKDAMEIWVRSYPKGIDYNYWYRTREECERKAVPGALILRFREIQRILVDEDTHNEKK